MGNLVIWMSSTEKKAIFYLRNVLLGALIILLHVSSSKGYNCTAGLDCISQQICFLDPIECDVGMYCPGAFNRAQLCPKGKYCPSPSDILDCPKGSFCRTSSIHPSNCEVLSVCPAEVYKQRRFLYLVIDVIAVVVATHFFVGRKLYSKYFTSSPSKPETDKEKKTKEDEFQVIELKDVQNDSQKDVNHHNDEIKELNSSASMSSTVSSSAMFKIAPRFDIKFKDLGLILKKKKGSRTLMEGVTGEFRSGRVNAILGPSGAGKTTLMSILCGKVKKTSGAIYINEKIDSISRYRKLVGFVPQEDVMLRTLTVRQNLEHSARLRLPRTWNVSKKMRMVDKVIDLLGLKHVQHSVVGDEATRGVSGGERKRVNIGIELVALPHILFLDEPTTGLDSTTSKEIMLFLRKIAQNGTNIITVIHQPRYEIVQLCDRLLLLGKGGRTVFLGETEEALQYFEEIGFTCPPFFNPADFFMDVISGKVPRNSMKNDPSPIGTVQEESSNSSFDSEGSFGSPSDESSEKSSGKSHQDKVQIETSTSVPLSEKGKQLVTNEVTVHVSQKESLVQQFFDPKELVSLWERRSKDSQPPETEHKIRSKPEDDENEDSQLVRRDMPNFLEQIWIYIIRSGIQQMQDIKGLVLEVAYQIIPGAAMGVTALSSEIFIPPIPSNMIPLCPSIISYRCENEAVRQGGVSTSAFFMTMVVGAAAVISSNKTFGEEKSVYYREKSSGINSFSYFLAKNIFDLWNILRNCFILLTFYMLMSDPPGTYGKWFGSIYMMMFCAYGMGYLVSNLVSMKKALVISVVAAVALSVTSGLSPTLTQLEDYAPLEVFWWISYNRWGAESMILNELDSFKHMRYEQSIRNLGYKPGNYGADIGAMFVIGIAWRILAFIALKLVNRRKQK